jgi:hypothetical protein
VIDDVSGFAQAFLDEARDAFVVFDDAHFHTTFLPQCAL